MYVDIDGSATSSAVFQNIAAWGSVVVTGLLPDTEYSFNAVAKNNDDIETEFSTGKTIYTLANIPGAPTLDDLTTSTAELVLDVNDNPAYTTFAIYNNIAGNYFATDGTPTSTAVYQTVSSWGTPTILTGLTPNIEYEFAVFAKNQFGTVTDMSNATAIVVTYADVPDELVVESVTTSTIVISWEDSGATQYKLYNVTDADSLVASVSITTATATDLECGTSYAFRLSAHNLVDESSLTDATVTTSTLACPVEEEEEEEPSSGGGAGGMLLQKPNFGSTVGTDVNALTRAITVHRNRPTTTVRRVRVHIPAYIDTSEVAISTTSSFDGVRYRSIPRSRTIIVTLPKGYGKKELNIKLRTATGGTAVIKKEIVYEKRKTVVSVATPSVVPTTPIVSVPITTTFVSFLSRGSQGAEVLALQQVLQRAGYFPSTITPNGVYGPSTEESVRAFQRASSLDPLGYVGPGTRAALNAL